jgi:hypothetical protein
MEQRTNSTTFYRLEEGGGITLWVLLFLIYWNGFGRIIYKMFQEIINDVRHAAIIPIRQLIKKGLDLLRGSEVNDLRFSLFHNSYNVIQKQFAIPIKRYYNMYVIVIHYNVILVSV